MGVLFDYFRASDASTAAAVLEQVGGPRDPEAPALDAVAGRGFEPEVMLRKLQSLLTGVPYEELSEAELVAMEGEDGPGSCSCRRNFAMHWLMRRLAVCQWLSSGGCAPRSSGTRRPQPRCCRFWTRSLPWRVVPGRLVSACTAGSACSGRSARRHRGCRSTWVA